MKIIIFLHDNNYFFHENNSQNKALLNIRGARFYDDLYYLTNQLMVDIHSFGAIRISYVNILDNAIMDK